jgi:hypothetical protein
MDLVNLYPAGHGPESKEMYSLFDSVHELGIDPRSPVIEVEHELGKYTDPRNPDSMLLYDYSLHHIGEPLSRNWINYGMTVSKGCLKAGEGIIDMKGTHVVPGNISKLPGKQDPKVMLIGVNPDNELITLLAKAHAKHGDDIFVYTATSWKDDWQAHMEELYRDVIGLGKDQYRFGDVPVNSLSERGRGADFQYELRRIFRNDFMPDTIVQIGPGKSEDHTAAYFLTRDFVDHKDYDINLLLADCIEHNDIDPSVYVDDKSLQPVPEFKPRLWVLMDGKEIANTLSVYHRRNDLQYIEQVANLTRRLPTGSSKVLSYLTNKLIDPTRSRDKDDASTLTRREMFSSTVKSTQSYEHLESMQSDEPFMHHGIDVGAFGLQVCKLRVDENTGYQIPNVTHLFDRPDLF